MSLRQRLQDLHRRNQKIQEPKWKPILRRLERHFKFLLFLPLGWFLRPKRFIGKLDLASVNSVLILRHDAIGDVVLSTPIWRSIKKYAPHIRIGVVASARNRALLDADPDVDDVFVFTRTFSRADLVEIKRARTTRWDVALGLFFADKTISAIYARCVAPQAIRATVLRSDHDKYRRIYSVVGERPRHDTLTPMEEQIMLVATDVLQLPLTDEDRKPSLKYSPEWDTKAAAAVAQSIGDSRQYIILNTDAAAQFRDWGLDNCEAFTRMMQETYPEIQVLWTSAPSRSATVKDYLSRHKLPNAAYFESPHILMLVGAIRGALAVVSPDTSVVHITCALRRPLVALYWERNEFPPLHTEYKLLLTPNRTAMSNIRPESVFEALRELLSARQ